MADTTAPPASRWARLGRAVPADGWLARALHVFVLSAVAIAQPLWSLLVENVEFLVNRRSDRAEILAVALLLLFVPPAVTMAVETVAGLVSKRAATVLHALAVAGFALLIFLRVLVRLAGGNTLVVVGLSLAGAIGALAYYATTAGARRLLTLAGPVPVLFLAMFVLNADVRPLVFPTERSQGITVTFRQTPPVVFLVFDEFPLRGLLDRDLKIDQMRTPNFARFAAASTWYRKTSTVHEVSEMAVPAILAGVRSPKKQVPTADNFPVNLFSVFTAGGYDVRAAEVLTRLCTPATCQDTPELPPFKQRVKSHLKDLGVVYGHQVLPRGVAESRLPDIGLTWGNFGTGSPPPGGTGGGNGGVGPAGVREDIRKDQQPRLDDFVQGFQTTPTPTLHYLHLLMPHAPFDRLPNGKRYPKGRSFIGIDLKTGYFGDDDFATDQAEQRNLLQVGYTDLQFGRILEALERTGLYDNALIVVASDHGSTNRPKLNRRAFDGPSLGDIGAVPLFVKLPGQRSGAVDDVDAQTIDIFPTVADILGFEIPGQVTGRSLLDKSAPPRERQFIDQFGNVMTATPEFPELQQSVDHMYSRFHVQEDGFLNVFGTGPYKGLVGRKWASLPAGSGTLSARLDDPEYWRTGAPNGLSPAHQTGTLDGRPAGSPRGTPVHLAIAVGDVVVATSRSFDVEGDTAKLDMFVPDEQLAPDHAEVRLFAVSGDPGRPELTPVPWR